MALTDLSHGPNGMAHIIWSIYRMGKLLVDSALSYDLVNEFDQNNHEKRLLMVA